MILTSKKITKKDIASIFRQLSTLLAAGMPLFQAIKILFDQASKAPLKILLSRILSDMNQGFALSTALAKYPRYFNLLACQLIKSGELSGNMDQTLDRLADHQEKMLRLKNKIKKALIYPGAILSMSFLMMGIMLEMIIPQFQNLFEGVGASLPWITNFIINLSILLKHWGILFLIILAGIIYFLYYLKKNNASFSAWSDKKILNIPGLGTLLKKSLLVRWARTFATIFAAGVPIIDSLKAVATLGTNYVFRQAMHQLQQTLSKGGALAEAMQLSHFFPSLMIEMIKVGEVSGNLDIMLEKIADYYENDLNQLTEVFLQLLEPMIIMILGVIISVLIVAMYLPIFRLGMVI